MTKDSDFTYLLRFAMLQLSLSQENTSTPTNKWVLSYLNNFSRQQRIYILVFVKSQLFI